MLPTCAMMTLKKGQTDTRTMHYTYCYGWAISVINAIW